ncbi:MAG TPA: hypothetical protein VMA36_20955 [Candidatus Limnocylindria bacterium]|jgi:hypothetical protein|nr:hypothetical protein [Candidatus Limnocylindria bacterium]
MRSLTATPQTARAKQNQLVYVAIMVILVAIIARSLFGHHENKYEKIARDMTVALQANDLATVKKFQNAETATEVNRARVGHAADVLGPLGKLQTVKEVTAQGAAPRVHDFDLRFKNGSVHETMKLDPEDKIVRFNYNVVPAAK